MTVRTSDNQAISADGNLDFDVIPGATYGLMLAGTFGGGTVTPKFLDEPGNAVNVPAPGAFKSVTSPAAFTEPGILEIKAITPKLRLTMAGSTTPAVRATVTRLNEEKQDL